MNRRDFIRGLLSGSTTVLAPERVYAFLTNNPFAPEYGVKRGIYATRSDFDAAMKIIYPAGAMAPMIASNPFLRYFNARTI